jgi:osmotically-inducible protein OsmY
MIPVKGADMETLTKTDIQIQMDVLRELNWDTRIAQTEVGVEVDKGVVTLTGTVDSYAKKTAAEQAAHRVVGVLDVANDIKIHYAGVGKKTDAEIAQAVRETLEWDVFVPDQKIRSTVADGHVTLEGRVSVLREKEDAEFAVRRLAGVTGVWNRIEVERKKVDPKVVQGAIEQALERRAEREAERIRVEVSDGSVTLSGTVRSWLEKNAILGSARHAPGVARINDHLRIDPFF